MKHTHTKTHTISPHHRMLSGKVVSTKMKNTAVVEVSRYFKHPKYGKYLLRTKRYKVHDEGNTCHEGDTVFIKETKPISKDKHFTVIQRSNIKNQNGEGETENFDV